MNENTELRNIAWNKLWGEKWFGKILFASILLNLISRTIHNLVRDLFNTSLLQEENIKTLLNQVASGAADFGQLKHLSIFAVVFLFLTLITVGITKFGKSIILINAAENKSEDWLGAAFSGFKMPLGLAALSFRVTMVFIGWSILAILTCGIIGGSLSCLLNILPENELLHIASLCILTFIISSFSIAIISIPIYRYRYLFRLKADNPEWSAGKCMRKCRALTKGEKWRIFKHDCAYWRILLAPILIVTAVILLKAHQIITLVANNYLPSTQEGTMPLPESLAAFANPEGCIAYVYLAIYLLAFILFAIAGIYISVGQTLLYRKIVSEKAKDTDNTDE
jgi:uncharacterized membrane protein